MLKRPPDRAPHLREHLTFLEPSVRVVLQQLLAELSGRGLDDVCGLTASSRSVTTVWGKSGNRKPRSPAAYRDRQTPSRFFADRSRGRWGREGGW
jgi:hypothetical protein